MTLVVLRVVLPLLVFGIQASSPLVRRNLLFTPFLRHLPLLGYGDVNQSSDAAPQESGRFGTDNT